MFSFGKKAPAPLSIDEELDRIGAGRFHVFTLVACSLTSASQSIILNLLPLLQPCAGYALGRTAPADAASTSTAAFVVACVAAPLIALASDAYGRRPATLAPALVLAAAFGVAVTAPTYISLSVLIAIGSVGMGAPMVPLCLAAELCPPKSRGALLNVINWVWSAATVLVIGMGWLFVGSGAVGGDVDLGWRALLATSTAPLALGACLACCVSESPHWLEANGRHREAEAVLRRIARENDAPWNRPIPTGGLEDKMTVAGGGGLWHRRGACGELLRAFFGAGRWRRVVVHWTLWLSGSFGWAGLLYFHSHVLQREDGRVSAALVATSTTSLAAQPLSSGCAFDFGRLMTVGASELVGVALLQLIIDRPMGPKGLLGGRRGSQASGYFLASLFGFLMAFELGPVGVVVMGVLSRALITTANSAMTIAAPELYATETRTVGINIAFALNLLGSAPASEWVASKFSPLATAALLSFANVVAGCCALALPETAGRKLTDVDVGEAAPAAAGATKGADYGALPRR